MKPKNEKKYEDIKVTKRKKIMNIVYLVFILLVFECIGLMFLVFPRSTVSETEKRKLAEFPELTADSYFSGEFTEGVSDWFSDTVPFRDELMDMSASIQELNGFRQNDIKIHGVGTVITPEQKPQTTPKPQQTTAPDDIKVPEDETNEPQSKPLPEETVEQGNSLIEAPETDEAPDNNDAVNIKNNGVAVVGSGKDTRALMLYGGSYTGGEMYAKVINKYKDTFGDNVNVYSMMIPTAAEFYSPAEVKPYTASQLDNINWVIENLSDDVKAVDVYTPLSQHTGEDIYMRTDHHWASLGAYYAAQKFAEVAGVPFMDISEYEQKVVRDYVGTMYTYSDYDPNVKNNPENFYYYVPQRVDFTTTYYEYLLDENGAISGERDPYDGAFFIKYSDGNSMAYCTFMGGDAKLTRVKTSTKNGRKLAILKDSFGNALPGFLFGSFEEIYVVDMRYFTKNIVEYFTETGVTDILFANNAFHAVTGSTVKYYEKFLTQNVTAAPPKEETSSAPVETTSVTETTSSVPEETSSAPEESTAETEETSSETTAE